MSYWLLLLPAAFLAWTAVVAAVGVAIQAADRNEPIAIGPAIAARIAREAIARALLRLLSPLAIGRPGPRPTKAPPNARRPPVVLLCGLTWNRSSCWPLATFLRRRGWRWVHPIDRRSAKGTLASEAEALAEEIRGLCVASGSHQVDLVAFSTGGLVASWYLRHHGADRVRRLVTLGTAWRGTRLAIFGRGRAVEEIRYQSHVLDDLWPPPVSTVCVFSPDDPVVVPAASAVPPDKAEMVKVEACGHVEMLVSARVFRAVQAALDRPARGLGTATQADRQGATGAEPDERPPDEGTGTTLIPEKDAIPRPAAATAADPVSDPAGSDPR